MVRELTGVHKCRSALNTNTNILYSLYSLRHLKTNSHPGGLNTFPESYTQDAESSLLLGVGATSFEGNSQRGYTKPSNYCYCTRTTVFSTVMSITTFGDMHSE